MSKNNVFFGLPVPRDACPWGDARIWVSGGKSMNKDTYVNKSVSDEEPVRPSGLPAGSESAIGVEKLADLFFKVYSESKQTKLALSIYCAPYEDYVTYSDGRTVRVLRHQWHIMVDIEEGEKIQELKAKVQIIDTYSGLFSVKEIQGFHWDVYRKLAELVAEYRPSVIRALLCRWEPIWIGEVKKE